MNWSRIVVGGIAGGIASREVVKNVRQRQKREQQNIRETEPLLGGQRLGGGNSGFNRLTGDKMYRSANDPEIQNMNPQDLELL
ncbi:MAG: hypothetical protein ACK53L_31650, partial [Pirellulaceae bacterium]